MIKGIVFDLDHTLFDRYATLTEIAPLMYEHFRFKISDGLGIEDVVTTLIYADRMFNNYGWKTVLKYLHDSGFFKESVDYEDYESHLKHCFSQVAVPFDFTHPLLQTLCDNGYKIGLITNGTEFLQNKKIDLLGIRRYFDEIIIANGKISKPDTAPFEIMSQKLEISPDKLIYVGDHPINDVDASRRVGYTPVWVKTGCGWTFPDVKRCSFEIDTANDLLGILDKI